MASYISQRQPGKKPLVHSRGRVVLQEPSGSVLRGNRVLSPTAATLAASCRCANRWDWWRSESRSWLPAAPAGTVAAASSAAHRPRNVRPPACRAGRSDAVRTETSGERRREPPAVLVMVRKGSRRDGRVGRLHGPVFVGRAMWPNSIENPCHQQPRGGELLTLFLQARTLLRNVHHTRTGWGPMHRRRSGTAFAPCAAPAHRNPRTPDEELAEERPSPNEE